MVAEAELLLGLVPDRTEIDPSAMVDPRAQVGEGTVIGPHAMIGPQVKLGANCRIGASVVIDGWTELGDDCEVYPFASIGQIPQDLKFHEKLREAFLTLALEAPERCVIIRANAAKDDVAKRVWQAVDSKLKPAPARAAVKNVAS
jgi:acyl-[acyl carrier protein]--UDP-N-acetylglucosamine O-acyltransferase